MFLPPGGMYYFFLSCGCNQVAEAGAETLGQWAEVLGSIWDQCLCHMCIQYLHFLLFMRTLKTCDPWWYGNPTVNSNWPETLVPWKEGCVYKVLGGGRPWDCPAGWRGGRWWGPVRPSPPQASSCLGPLNLLPSSPAFCCVKERLAEGGAHSPSHCM